MLMSNQLSMAAGELFAFICVAAAVYFATGTATHVIGLTDNDPTAAAVNHSCSGSRPMFLNSAVGPAKRGGELIVKLMLLPVIAG